MKIAIVGSGGTWIAAPFEEPEWTIWGFSRRNYGKYPRCDLWFELHSPKLFSSYDKQITGYVDWLKSFKARMTQPLFPKDAILERFGSHFFSHGQVPWIMAYAITQEPEAIGLWGIEGAGPYKGQRAEIQHFAQVARDHKIVVSHNEILEPNKLYAFS